MTAIVETFRNKAIVGGIKFISIQTSAAADTGHTIDFDSDAAHGRGTVLHEILNTLLQDDAGADVTGTFDPATGIYTFGSVTTGIHNLFVVGR